MSNRKKYCSAEGHSYSRYQQKTIFWGYICPALQQIIHPALADYFFGNSKKKFLNQRLLKVGLVNSKIVALSSVKTILLFHVLINNRTMFLLK